MKIVKKKTIQLSNSEIKKIIRIKMQFWKYSFKSQNKWFIDKIKSNDLHFFIGSKTVKLYCCLRLGNFFYKKKKINFYYLDTLCSLKRYRYLVINFLNFVIKNTKDISTITLSSKEHLFLYTFFGFKKIKNIKILNHDVKNLNILLNIPKNNLYKKIFTSNKIELKI
tara:strand:+ start:273 stop:773 length:501 start_codon:yes stop_codon:yes gene_type:complete